MASSVATPLETQFGQIPGLLQMTSARALGFTQVTLQFDLSRALDGAVSDTLSAINAASAQLPPNMPSTHMRCMITANRRARATIAFFIPRRLATCIARAFRSGRKTTSSPGPGRDTSSCSAISGPSERF
jgi:multidrug efflux pump subunit AcrB